MLLSYLNLKYRQFGIAFGVALVFFIGLPPVPVARAVDESASAPSALTAGMEESRIGADDLLEITVFEAAELNCVTRVFANGEISMQLLGPIKAVGLTPRELELVIQELLRRSYMREPHVGVFIRELQSHTVSVVGAVKKPGVFQIRGTKTLIELLSMSEGLADDAGDTVLIVRAPVLPGPALEQASNSNFDASSQAVRDSPGVPASLAVSRGEASSEIISVNLKTLLESTDSANNISVHPGDVVKVTRAGIIYVVGEVRKPGGYLLKNNENISVLQALALAEGLTPTSAKSRARIIRTDQKTAQRLEIPLNLGKILASKVSDPLLQARDIIFVPDSSAKAALYRGAEAALTTATGVAIYRR